MNPVEIEEAVTQLASEPFDRAEFPFQFLTAFGNKKTTIDRLRKGNTNQSDLAGGVLQRSNIHIATCATGSVGETLTALRDSPKTGTNKAKFILATDGEEFQAEDLTSGETVACDYADFPDHFGFFLPLAGITTVEQIRESSFDIKATGRLNRLYVELLKDNPDWAKAERRPDMNHFMARLIFCFFAEDTDIFPVTSRFTQTIERMSAGDAGNTHEVIQELFRAMNTKQADREKQGIARWAEGFPYVNGQLFSGSTDVPRFSKIARSYLIHIGSLDWTKINPDIFGSMIQAVADDEERGALGMHYTSVPNILKVLNPLFLDDLRAKLDEAGDNGRKLLNLRNRMARIRVFDPACGSGNFLVIAYKEMRAIEAEINKRRGEPDRRSEIPLTNFRGIELRDFPAEIARLALIIAEYQCDVLYRGQKEALAEFLPLNSENWITCGNALRLDWLSICPPTGTGVKVRGDEPSSAKHKDQPLEFWLSQHLQPAIAFCFKSLDYHGHRLVLLEIPAAATSPVEFDRTAFIRIGSATPRLADHPERQKLLWAKLQPYAWESGVAAQFQSSDEVLAKLDHTSYFELTGQPLPDNREGIFERLKADRLIEADVGGKWNITNLGAILFAKQLADFSPSIARKGVRFVAYEGNNRATKVTHRRDGQKGYACGFSGLADYIDGLLPSNEHIGKAFREEEPLYPSIAIRELIANALIHQDMTITGAGPLIELFKDRLEITNPGEPLVSPDRFLDSPPRSRNEALASLMRRMRLCEEQGTGIDKVLASAELHQLPPPDFQNVDTAVRATLFAPRRFADMTQEERVRACYQHAALKYVSGERMTNSSLRERFGIAEHNASQASAVIRMAQDEGQIRPADPEHPRAGYVPHWA